MTDHDIVSLTLVINRLVRAMGEDLERRVATNVEPLAQGTLFGGIDLHEG